MTTIAEVDSEIWTVTGVDICDVEGCYNPPVIITNVVDNDRFCDAQLDVAARVALRHHDFPGWYRLADTTTLHGQLIATVHPL